MIDFDKWFKNRHTKTGLYEEALCGKDDATYIRHEMRKSYLAGQRSQQAKIDELQARVDEALKMMDAESSNSWGLWKEKADMYEQGASDAYEKSYWILKGNKDEN